MFLDRVKILCLYLVLFFYLSPRFYVGCDLCNDWFHGDCVGITEGMAEEIDEFICKECRKEKEDVQEQELYCLCQQPYDESK